MGARVKRNARGKRNVKPRTEWWNYKTKKFTNYFKKNYVNEDSIDEQTSTEVTPVLESGNTFAQVAILYKGKTTTKKIKSFKVEGDFVNRLVMLAQDRGFKFSNRKQLNNALKTLVYYVENKEDRRFNASQMRENFDKSGRILKGEDFSIYKNDLISYFFARARDEDNNTVLSANLPGITRSLLQNNGISRREEDDHPIPPRSKAGRRSVPSDHGTKPGGGILLSLIATSFAFEKASHIRCGAFFCWAGHKIENAKVNAARNKNAPARYSHRGVPML